MTMERGHEGERETIDQNAMQNGSEETDHSIIVRLRADGEKGRAPSKVRIVKREIVKGSRCLLCREEET